MKFSYRAIEGLTLEYHGYFRAKEPGKRERAEAWATAIGLQKVDGLSASVPIRADIGR